MARDNEDVEDGWLCDKGRYGYQAVHSPERITQPLVSEGGALRETSWERALSAAATGLEKAGAATAALAGGETTNEEGFLLQKLLREALGSPHVDSRPSGVLDPEQARILARPDLSVPVWDIENAGTVLVFDTDLVEEAPIVDLRVRKARRRHGATVVVASSHPTTLDAIADHVVRFPPGGAEAALQELAEHEPRGGGPVVIIWGERLSHGAARAPRRRRAARARAQAEPGRHRRRRPARDPERHERPRAARGRLPAEPGPGPRRRAVRGNGRGGDRGRARRRPDRARAAPRRSALPTIPGIRRRLRRPPDPRARGAPTSSSPPRRTRRRRAR